ncbi:PASTA domain-containing protein [Nonomuraea sp. NPDC049152]|uniref:PASTA domain-containing protein n=1 Tax=Nonomuraea sp. NPDC049152 TaxID=3154350 RepID=UPI0033EC3B98
MRLTSALTSAAIVTAAGLAASCSTGTPPAATQVTVTATPPHPAETTTPAAKPSAALTDSAAERKRLPDVVGMNLQAAQDELQATGFYLLDDQDATGQRRLQVFDRNWVVVRQTPAAGKRVSTSTKVVLYAKKYGE